jgi:hypothetical protein
MATTSAAIELRRRHRGATLCRVHRHLDRLALLDGLPHRLVVGGISMAG